MMVSKFVQIQATAVAAKDTPAVNQYVYALDETGRVWHFDFKNLKWLPFPEERAPVTP